MDIDQQESLQDIQKRISSFSDPDEQEIAEDAAFNISAQLEVQKKHIVVLLHGMNTNAEWQEILAEPMRNSGEVQPSVLGYGNFAPLRFFVPYVFRIGRINLVKQKLLGLRERNPDANISVVAHSFGTYALTKILKSTDALKLHRVILCGSIVDTDFNWDSLHKQLTTPLVNDIGTKDIYPSLAKSWSWDYGDSGVIGFQHDLVRDRHFDFGHSDFLNVSHMKQYWLPYLLQGEIVSSAHTLKRQPMKLVERIYRSLSWRHLILLAILFYCTVPNWNTFSHVLLQIRNWSLPPF